MWHEEHVRTSHSWGPFVVQKERIARRSFTESGSTNKFRLFNVFEKSVIDCHCSCHLWLTYSSGPFVGSILFIFDFRSNTYRENLSNCYPAHKHIVLQWNVPQFKHRRWNKKFRQQFSGHKKNSRIMRIIEDPGGIMLNILAESLPCWMILTIESCWG